MTYTRRQARRDLNVTLLCLIAGMIGVAVILGPGALAMAMMFALLGYGLSVCQSYLTPDPREDKDQ